MLGYALAAAFSIPVRHFFWASRKAFPCGSLGSSASGVYCGWYVEMHWPGLAVPFLNRLLEVLPDRELLPADAGCCCS